VNDGAGVGVLKMIEADVGIVETAEGETSELDDDCTEAELAKDWAFKLEDDETSEVELKEDWRSELLAEDSGIDGETMEEAEMIDDELTEALVEEDEKDTDDETADDEAAEDDDNSALQLPNPGWHPVPQ
jgi:hypothetical protein